MVRYQRCARVRLLREDGIPVGLVFRCRHPRNHPQRLQSVWCCGRSAYGRRTARGVEICEDRRPACRRRDGTVGKVPGDYRGVARIHAGTAAQVSDAHAAEKAFRPHGGRCRGGEVLHCQKVQKSSLKAARRLRSRPHGGTVSFVIHRAIIDYRTNVLYASDMSQMPESMEEYRETLARFYREHKRMPSFSELMDLWDYKTKSAVHYRIEKLSEAGIIGKDGTGRIIPRSLESGTKLLGLVEAGFPSPAEEELLDVMNFDEYLTPNKESSYILKVKGDSMIDAGIREGYMVVVERRAQYKVGQIVVASIDNEYTMKYLRRSTKLTAGKKEGDYYLEPANENYKPIYPNDTFRIEAVVIAVVRKY